jgi:hypothetical protein
MGTSVMTTTSVEQGTALEVVASTAVIGMPALLEKLVIKKDQDGIRVSLIKLDARIHANAVQCLMHAEKHGDTSLMRRLLVDIVDEKSGYRRQGLIAWMREFSPMILKGDNITLGGTLNNERKPFRVEQANITPFTSLSSAREMVAVRPIFRDNLTSKVERAIREYRAAVENTIIEPGKPPAPKDVKKPFYDGIHLDKMEEFFDKLDNQLGEVMSWNDSTKDVRVARDQMVKAQLELEEASKQ